MHTLQQRAIGALMLNTAIYEEIEDDPGALQQAAMLVAIVALVSGLIGGAMNSGHFLTGLVGHLLSTLVGWVVWGVVIWLVGTRIFDAEAEAPEVLRVIGFAYAPALFSAFPCIGPLVMLWLLATGFFATRAVLDLDNAETVVTLVVSLVAYAIVMLAILIPLGLGQALLGAIF